MSNNRIMEYDNVVEYENDLVKQLKEFKVGELDSIQKQIDNIINLTNTMIKAVDQVTSAQTQINLSNAYGHLYNDTNVINEKLKDFAKEMQHALKPSANLRNFAGVSPNYPSQEGATQKVYNNSNNNMGGGRRKRRSKTNKRKATRGRKASRRAATRHRRRN